MEPLTSSIYEGFKLDTPARCITIAPHIHSIYCPEQLALPPWELNLERNILLGYFGSAHGNRSRTLSEFKRAQSLQNQYPSRYIVRSKKNATIYSTPEGDFYQYTKMGQKHDMNLFIQFWELFATSIFSWEPAGDAITRRAFYDSWVFGCIPVISSSSAEVYSRIYNGIIFVDHPIEDVVVVVPDETFYDGYKLIAHLASMTRKEISTKQSGMKLIAPVMQWGWESYGEALTLVFASLLTSTKQSIALSRSKSQISTPSTMTTPYVHKDHKDISREEFEASIVVNNRLVNGNVEANTPTMMPTKKAMSRDEFEKSLVISDEKGRIPFRPILADVSQQSITRPFDSGDDEGRSSSLLINQEKAREDSGEAFEEFGNGYLLPPEEDQPVQRSADVLPIEGNAERLDDIDGNSAADTETLFDQVNQAGVRRLLMRTRNREISL